MDGGHEKSRIVVSPMMGKGLVSVYSGEEQRMVEMTMSASILALKSE
mgnify:CR=1 FL=1